MIRSPLTFKNGFGWKTGLAIELVIIFLAALFCLELLVSPYYYISHRSNFAEDTPMRDVVSVSIMRWHTMQDDANVRISYSDFFSP